MHIFLLAKRLLGRGVVGRREPQGDCPGVTGKYLCLGESDLVLGLVIGLYKCNCLLPFPAFPLPPYSHPQYTHCTQNALGFVELVQLS